MLSAVAQVEASRSPMVQPRRMIQVCASRSHSFESPVKLDLLFLILAFIPLEELFRVRRVCKSWRQRIDNTKNDSREWNEIFLAHSPPLAQYAATSMAIQKAFMSAEPPPYRTVLLKVWLYSVRRAAVLAATTLGARFNHFVDMDGFRVAYTIVYHATNNDLSEFVYQWWQTSTPMVCAEIQKCLVQEPESARRTAADSFDSYVKVMAAVLTYLDRVYVGRFKLATIEEVAAPCQAALYTGLQLGAQRYTQDLP